MARFSEPRPPGRLRSRPIAVGQLRAFDAVARHLNFRAAAEELALTQSAVSRQIQALEEDVGVALFLPPHPRGRADRRGRFAVARLATVTRAHRQRGAPDSAQRGAQERRDHDLGIVCFDVADPAARSVPARAPRHRHPHRCKRCNGRPGHRRHRPGLALRRTRRACRPRPSGCSANSYAVVASPWLLKGGTRVDQPADLAAFTLIEASDDYSAPAQGLAELATLDSANTPRSVSSRGAGCTSTMPTRSPRLH